jgi:hypothetical protein
VNTVENLWKVCARFQIPSSYLTPVPSVADPGCLSRILIFSHPVSWIQIQQQQKKSRVIIDELSYLSFVAKKSKISINFIFEQIQEKC